MSENIINQKEASILIIGYLRDENLLNVRNADESGLDLIITQCVSYYFIPQKFPSLIVLDLDACTWTPETYFLRSTKTGVIREMMNGKELITKVRFGSQILEIFDGVRTALMEVYSDRYDGLCNPNINGGNMRFAIASSADDAHAVKCAHSALSTIEIEPGVTIRDVVNRGWDLDVIKNGHIQIGRSYPLTSNKSQTHFPFIQKATGVPYDEMLFFDDCNWEDNCEIVEKNCVGVVGLRTPNGLTVRNWREGLNKWQERREEQT